MELGRGCFAIQSCIHIWTLQTVLEDCLTNYRNGEFIAKFLFELYCNCFFPCEFWVFSWPFEAYYNVDCVWNLHAEHLPSMIQFLQVCFSQYVTHFWTSSWFALCLIMYFLVITSHQLSSSGQLLFCKITSFLLFWNRSCSNTFWLSRIPSLDDCFYIS